MEIINCKNPQERTSAEAEYADKLKNFGTCLKKHKDLVIADEIYNQNWFNQIKARTAKLAYSLGAPNGLEHSQIHYFLVKKDALTQINPKHGTAYSDQSTRELIVEYQESPILMELAVVHEIIHLFGRRIDRWNKGALSPYRTGLSLCIAGTKYFRRMEEAFVALCCQEYFNHYLLKSKKFQRHITIAKELRETLYSILLLPTQNVVVRRRIKEGIQDLLHFKDVPEWEKLKDILNSDLPLEYKEAIFEKLLGKNAKYLDEYSLERKSERKQFNAWIKNLEKISGKPHQEIFNAVAQAHFHGHYLPLARIISSVMGRYGFRLTAEAFANR